jgi:excisionase family DNA binding protein
MVEIVGVVIAADELGISTMRVRELIKLGKLPAQQIGREYAILRAHLEAFKKIERKAGVAWDGLKIEEDGSAYMAGITIPLEVTLPLTLAQISHIHHSGLLPAQYLLRLIQDDMLNS